MAFPGGGVDGQNRARLAAAERETLEEKGLRLPSRSHIGSLGEIRGAYLPVSIAAHVYHLERLPGLRWHKKGGALLQRAVSGAV